LDGGSTDNGVIDTIIADQTNFDCSDVGSNTITLTVTDLDGNSATCDAIVTVLDTINPSFTSIDTTIYLDVLGVYTIDSSYVSTAYIDNCELPNVTLDQSDFDCSEIGSNTVTITATDASGNTSVATATVMVEDSISPFALCMDSVNIGLDPSGNAVVTSAEIDNGSNDACGIDTLILSQYNFTNLELGPNPEVMTVIDVNGNSSSCNTVVSVIDLTPPVPVCQDITIYLDSIGGVSINDTDIDGGSTDNGIIASIVADQTSFDCSETGDNDVVLTVTDNAGNFSTCTAVVTVLDVINPSFTALDTTIFLDETGNYVIDSTYVSSNEWDNCTTPAITLDEDAFDCAEVGSNTVTITATDASGNITIDSATLMVVDTIAPVAICQDISVSTDALGNATITAAEINNGSNDACGIDTLMLSQYDFTSLELGANPEVMTVIDVNGNVSTCDAIVTLLDLTPPEAVCSDTTLYLDQNGLVSITDIDLDGGSTDNGVIASIIAHQTDFSCSDLGVVSDTLTVTDSGGNTDFCVAMVTVLDSISPIIMTCAIDTTEYLDDSCGYVMKDYRSQMLSTDNCTDTLDIIYTQVPAVGETFGGVGTVIPVTITGTDESGNFTSCSFEVSLVDSIAPVIVCPLDITVDSDLGDCSAQVTVPQPDVSDNCDYTFTNNFTGTDNGSALYSIDTTYVTWTAIDVSGNFSECVQTIIVEDNEAPEIECSPDVTFNNDEGNCGAIVTYTDTEYSDNCTIDELVLVDGLASGSFFDVGTTLVSYTVTDVYGNSGSCSFDVLVIDAELPVIMCPGDIVTNDSIVIYDEPFFTDNCSSDLTLIDGYYSGDEFPHGYTTVTYLTTDLAGLTAECSFEVLVNHDPVAVNDSVMVSEIEYTDLIIPLDNDYDLDMDEITIISAEASVGIVEIGADNELTYNIPNEWCGTDSIIYIIEDIYGATDTATVHVDVECLDDLIIPQVFTPNGDGINDAFEIFGIYKYPNNELQVYNRWGHKVYTKKGYNNTWKGTSEAELTIGNLNLPVGTYFYVLKLSDDIPLYKGYVYIKNVQN